MPAPKRLSGVLTPVVVPFDAGLKIDRNRLLRQCSWLITQGVGIAIFGTNSEGNSLSVEEKIDTLDFLVEHDIDPLHLMPGTGLCALPETVRLTAHAARLGCAGTLVLPPFFYKDVTDEGLFRSYAEVIERVGDAHLRIYLYHIPPVARVGLSTGLIDRLVARYPETVVGIKDSSGDWDNTLALHQGGWDDFRIFAGSESFLLRNMQNGGAGCISATANVNPAAINRLFGTWQESGAVEAQDALDSVRGIMQSYPMIPALKATVGHFAEDPEWRRVRPPLVELNTSQCHELIARLVEAGFDMPGLNQGANPGAG